MGFIIANRKKIWRCDNIAGSQICRVSGDHCRKRLGWCYTNYVRTPEDEESQYTGSKFGANMHPYQGDSSDSDNTRDL